jgi:cytochrome d ubiquinol oxidase subunit II
LIGAAVPFVVLFVAYLVHLLVKEGYAINAYGLIYMEPYKYLHNMIEMWGLLVLLLSGVIMVLFGIIYTIISKRFIAGIWQAGLGTIFTVLALLLLAGWNNTAYYPSTADLQSSLTLANSCSSEFTLRTMFYVSLLVPFVLAYIFYAWRAIDKKKITKEEIASDDHAY